MTKLKVAVLVGGISKEREGSLKMGKNCAEALRESGLEVVEIDAGHDIADQLLVVRPGVAFNALMGRGGEDGAIQGLLEWMRIPYTHSGVLASALAMDKSKSRSIYQANGLPVATGKLIKKDELRLGHPMAPPYVLKPNTEGSSIGIRYIFDKTVPNAFADPELDEELLVEEYADGIDLTVGIFEDRPLAVTAVKTATGVWDYDSKYHITDAQMITPADLPSDIARIACDMAQRAHNALGCRFISRTDFRWNPQKGQDGFTVLETNNQPAIGFGGSFDQQLAIMNISLSKACEMILNDASLDR